MIPTWIGRGESERARGGGRGPRTTEGKIEGKRDALLRLLVRAGIALTEEDRARIETCTGTAILDRWLDNLLGAKTVTDILS